MTPAHEVVVTTGNARAMLDHVTGEVMHPVVGPSVESRQLYAKPSGSKEETTIAAVRSADPSSRDGSGNMWAGRDAVESAPC